VSVHKGGQESDKLGGGETGVYAASLVRLMSYPPDTVSWVKSRSDRMPADSGIELCMHPRFQDMLDVTRLSIGLNYSMV